MLEADIDILRGSLITVLNAFLSKTGWAVLFLLFLEFSRNFVLTTRQEIPLSATDTKKLLTTSLVRMRVPMAYAISGFLLMFFAYAIIHSLVAWLDPFCASPIPFQTELFQNLKAWTGISGLLGVTGLVFAGFSLALSLGKSRWLIGLCKVLVIMSFVTIFSGMVLTCNLPAA